MPGWAATTGSSDQLNRLGFFTVAAAQSPIDAGVEAMAESDRATAEHLGRRVAEHAAVWVAGRSALA